MGVDTPGPTPGGHPRSPWSAIAPALRHPGAILRYRGTGTTVHQRVRAAQFGLTRPQLVGLLPGWGPEGLDAHLARWLEAGLRADPGALSALTGLRRDPTRCPDLPADLVRRLADPAFAAQVTRYCDLAAHPISLPELVALCDLVPAPAYEALYRRLTREATADVLPGSGFRRLVLGWATRRELGGLVALGVLLEHDRDAHGLLGRVLADTGPVAQRSAAVIVELGSAWHAAVGPEGPPPPVWQQAGFDLPEAIALLAGGRRPDEHILRSLAALRAGAEPGGPTP